MSNVNIRAELPGRKDEYVYVRGYYVPPHYRRFPRRSLVDPATEKEVFRLFMSAMLQEREKERIRKSLLEVVALRKRLHASSALTPFTPRFILTSPLSWPLVGSSAEYHSR